MNATESDLRDVLHDRAGDEAVESLERRLHDTLLVRSATETRTGGRRGSVLGAVAAVAAVVALALGLGASLDRPDTRQGTPSSGSSASVSLSWTIRLEHSSTYRMTFRSVTAARELVGLHLVGAQNATCSCSEAAATTLLAVYRHGFHPDLLRHREATTFAGRTAYFGTMAAGDLDAMTGSTGQQFATLAFQYHDGDWAIALGRTQRSEQPRQLRTAAALLRVGTPTTIRVPFRLGEPHGLHVLSFMQRLRVDRTRPYSTFTLSTGPGYGTGHGRALLIQLYPAGAVSPVILTEKMTRPIRGGVRNGHTDPDIASARTPEAYFRLGERSLVYLSGQGVRGSAFVGLVHHLRWAPHVTADPRSWLPAAVLTRDH